MKVVHLASHHVPFDSRVFVRECRTLAAAGHDVSLIVAADEELDIVRDGVHVTALPRPRGRLARMIVLPFRLMVAARARRPDLVHLHDPALLPVAVLSRLLGVRFVYDSHESLPDLVRDRAWVPPTMRRPLARIARWCERAAVRAADAVVAAEPIPAERFPAHKRVVVQNLPDLTEFEPSRALGVQRERATAIYLGFSSRNRGAVEMVRAIEHANARCGATLHLAGPVTEEGLFDALRSEAGWKATRHTPWLDRSEVGPALASATVGLVLTHPTAQYRTNQPVKLFEYFAAGIPVIASGGMEWSTFVTDVRGGLLVDPLDPVAIAAAICWVVEHPEESAAMGERARAAVRDRLNWQSEAAVLVGLYERLEMTRR